MAKLIPKNELIRYDGATVWLEEKWKWHFHGVAVIELMTRDCVPVAAEAFLPVPYNADAIIYLNSDDYNRTWRIWDIGDIEPTEQDKAANPWTK